MTICLIGKNLTTLVLSKIFADNDISVELYYTDSKRSKNLHSTLSRTIGLSNDSINFLESHKILDKKKCWNIKQINLYKGKKFESFLNFRPKNSCFLMTSYNNFYKNLETKIKNNKLIKIKKKTKSNFSLGLIKKNYEMIIITDINNSLFKKYFSKHFKKNYNSMAFTTIINHQKIKNDVAEQFFTEFGPLAFLPISKTQTSIVFSIFDKNLAQDKKKILKLIEQYNRNYDIKNVNKIEKFPINLSLSRKYFYKNILLFGDTLHKIHPLAGQGFNMTLRDTKILNELIKKNLNLGLNLSTVLDRFEIKRKNSNFVFAMGIDFIHEFFKLNYKYNFKFIDRFFKFINKNIYIKKKIEKLADKGLDL